MGLLNNPTAYLANAGPQQIARYNWMQANPGWLGNDPTQPGYAGNAALGISGHDDYGDRLAGYGAGKAINTPFLPGQVGSLADPTNGVAGGVQMQPGYTALPTNQNQFAQPAATSSINDVYGANAGAILGMPGSTQASGGVPLSSITGGGAGIGGPGSALTGGNGLSTGDMGLDPTGGLPQTGAAWGTPGVMNDAVLRLNAQGQQIDASGNVIGNGSAGAASGGLPAFNPGETSQAYMTRIGMSPADQQRALAMAKQNPGMTFQQIMGQMQSGQGSTGNNVNGTSLGNLTNPSSSGGLGSVNGVPGYTGGGTFDINNWKDPGYDFRLQQGNQLLQGGAAASGNLLSGPTLKAITDYGQNSASQEYANAYDRFSGNRAFNYGVDTGDRNFNYATQVGDQNYNLQLAQALAGQGQFGASGAANTNQIIAALVSQNLLTGGQANAAGTIGGSNAITGGISGALGNLTSQQIINLILSQRGQS